MTDLPEWVPPVQPATSYTVTLDTGEVPVTHHFTNPGRRLFYCVRCGRRRFARDMVIVAEDGYGSDFFCKVCPTERGAA